MKKLLILLFSILISFNSYGNKVFFCNDELATGFHYKNNKYSVTNFTPQRHTIKFNDDFSLLSGLDDSDWECSDSYFSSTYNSISCISPYQNGGSFSYHKISKRYVFLESSTDGYIDNNSPSDDFLSAGTCKDF